MSDIFDAEDIDTKSLGIDEKITKVAEVVDTNNPQSINAEVVKDTINIDKKENIEGVPGLINSSYPSDYVAMANRIIHQYKMLPYIDYNKLYKELAILTIRSSPTPTLQILNQELQKVQAAKERATELMKDITTCFIFKERAVDILSDSWGYFSSEKSADKRKGEACFKLSEFQIDLAQTEAALKAALHVVKNLDSLQENLSRRITIFQLQLKLNDMGRGALPDMEFKDDIDDEFGVFKKNKSTTNSEGNSINAEAQNF